jgi:hypothetical protein
MEFLIELLGVLNSLTPLGVIALLGVTIFMLIKNKSTAAQVTKIETNDLHELPEMAQTLREILTILQRMEVEQGKEFSHIKARLNGHTH